MGLKNGFGFTADETSRYGSFRRVRLQLTAANNISGFSNDSDICERISNIRNMKDNLENRKKIS